MLTEPTPHYQFKQTDSAVLVFFDPCRFMSSKWALKAECNLELWDLLFN